MSYLVLDEPAHLVANQCVSCGARFFDRRNACASCFGTGFELVDVATEGTLTTFTIVAHAAPGVPVPFVAAVVDCDGTSVRGNLIGVDPDPADVKLGMRLKLVTEVIGTDDEGTEAVRYGFAPVEE